MRAGTALGGLALLVVAMFFDLLFSGGGRVLGVTALGETLEAALQSAYGAVGRIRWPGMHYRRDIGHRALGRATMPGER